jgi:hypothetical protein
MRFPVLPLLLLASACRSAHPPQAPAPEALPPLFFGSQGCYWGDFLSGDLPRSGTDEDASGLVLVRFDWIPGSHPELSAAPALEPSLGLLIGINRAQPVLPETSLLRRVRVLEQPEVALPLLELWRREGALLPGATASFALELPDAELRLRLEAAQGAGEQPPRLALWLAGPAPAQRPSPFADLDLDAQQLPLEELVQLPAASGEQHLLVAVPELEGWLRLSLVTVAGNLAEPQRLAALAPLARAQAEAAAARSSSAREPFDRRAFERQRRLAAVAALSRPAAARAALLTLADPGGARLAGDLALAADDEQLTVLASSLGERLTNRPELLEDAQQTALACESLALEFLTRLQSEGRLAPALEACLWLHGGELGRFPGTWLDLAQSARSVAELERSIAQENLTFLEDPTPAARVRAFDFLNKRGLAPAGFEPLASRTLRRQALSSAAEAAQAAATAANPPAGGQQ